jgi:hypothetical protein
VTVLLRDAAQADIAEARGATPVAIDLYDRRAVTSLLADADGAVHTASPGDATSAGLDSAVADAVTGAFAGTGKPYLHISGLWVYGDDTAITEDSPFQAPALASWREPIDRRVLGATGMRGVVIVASTAYGDGGGGTVGLLLGSPGTTPATWSCSARASSTGRPCTSRTWRISSGASWTMIRLVAATSSATG